MRRFILVGVLLLAFALRVFALGEKAVWWDEAWSVHVAQQSLAEATETTSYDVQPPLYQWALFGWIRAAGISEFAIRYLSLLWGLAAAAGTYTVAVRLGGRRAGELAAFFIALSALHIGWSQETRMYAMASAWAVLAVYAALRVRAAPGARGWWALLVLTGAAIPLTHYLGGFLLAILNLHWLLTWRTHSRAFRRAWIAAMIAIALVLGAWAIYAAGHIRSGGGDFEGSAAFVFQLAATLWATGASVDLDRYLAPTLLVMAGLIAGLALYARRRRADGLLIALLVICPPLVIYLLSLPSWRFYAPRPEARYLVIFVPLVYVAFGLALDALRREWRALGMAAALGLTLLYGAAFLREADNRYFRDDYASLFRTVDLLAAPGEPVFFVSDDRYPLVYYHLDRAAGGGSGLRARGIPLPVDDLDGHMRAIIGDAGRFWFVEIERNLSDPAGASVAWLDAHYARVWRAPFDHNALTLYAADTGAPPDSDRALPPAIREARPGDTVRIGVPDGATASLVYAEQVIASQTAAGSWSLLQFPIYPAYPPGEYTLRAPGTAHTFRVTHSQPAPDDPPANLDLAFGPLRLLGYTLDRAGAAPGESFELRLFWRADERPPEDYTVFVHLLGADNTVWATDDAYPAATPTTALWAGQVIADRHRLQVPDNMPPGWYSVEVGLYRLDTGERLSLPDGSDRALIPGFEVRR